MSINIRETKKNGRPYFAVFDNYWDADMHRSRQRVIKTLGYLDKYMPDFDSDDDAAREEAEALARKRVNELYLEIRKEYEKPEIEHIQADLSEHMEVGTSDLKNVGYVLFKLLYKELELDKFWKKCASGRKFTYNPDKIFQLLVYSRIINPGSKKYTYEKRGRLFEDFGEFTLDDIYHALDFYDEHEEELQQWLYEHSVTKYKRDVKVGYFDCTNYYYDISKPDIKESPQRSNR